MPEPAHAGGRTRVARAGLHPAVTPTPSSGWGYALPQDLLAKPVQRVGFLGLVCAVTAPLAYLTEYYLQPARVLGGRVPFPQIAAVALFVMGMAVFTLAWSRRLPHGLMLDLGLIFEVVAAFGISLSEFAGPWPPDQPIRGISWNSLWIAVFVVAVPGTFGKVILAAVGAALMAPLALLVTTVANRTPLPAPEQLLILLLPNFAAALWVIPVARHVYTLSAQVSKARAIGSYELLEPIGRGGMGEVWRARHLMLARTAAIKLIRPEALGDPAKAVVLLRRFEREARATAALRSPHTVALYDFGASEDGRFYYVMELLDGLSLEDLVRRFGPQPRGRVAFLLAQACRSLAEAHENGLIHRDIKPTNLFACRLGIERDFLKILDFGLVKVENQAGLTQEGVTTGTPAYMAPEIAAGRAAVDRRADLYSLGCVGYWLLTGRLLFERDSAMATLLAHLQEAPAPGLAAAPGSLEGVLLSCLEKDPARRPQSALDLAGALATCDAAGAWTEEDARRWWREKVPATESLEVTQTA